MQRIFLKKLIALAVITNEYLTERASRKTRRVQLPHSVLPLNESGINSTYELFQTRYC